MSYPEASLLERAATSEPCDEGVRWCLKREGARGRAALLVRRAYSVRAREGRALVRQIEILAHAYSSAKHRNSYIFILPRRR